MKPGDMRCEWGARTPFCRYWWHILKDFTAELERLRRRELWKRAVGRPKKFINALFLARTEPSGDARTWRGDVDCSGASD